MQQNNAFTNIINNIINHFYQFFITIIDNHVIYYMNILLIFIFFIRRYVVLNFFYFIRRYIIINFYCIYYIFLFFPNNNNNRVNYYELGPRYPMISEGVENEENENENVENQDKNDNENKEEKKEHFENEEGLKEDKKDEDEIITTESKIKEKNEQDISIEENDGNFIFQKNEKNNPNNINSK